MRQQNCGSRANLAEHSCRAVAAHGLAAGFALGCEDGLAVHKISRHNAADVLVSIAVRLLVLDHSQKPVA